MSTTTAPDAGHVSHHTGILREQYLRQVPGA